MKKTRLATLSLAMAVLLPSVTSCKSDASPFDWTITTVNNNKATIQLDLKVEETRADGYSTDEENEIKKLIVYVFDESQNLELTEEFDIEDDDKVVTLEVSNGYKTLYAVTAKNNVNPANVTNLTAYENSVFNSSLSNIMPGFGLTGEDGAQSDVQYVMVGKSDEQLVMKSASETDLPVSNKFQIQLVRLIAKAQVKSVGADGSAFGIHMGKASFKAFQLNERMRVVHDGTDVFDSGVSTFQDSDGDGTYDNYTFGVGEYQDAVEAFTGSGCAYLSENIVSNPLSGNTTFLGIRFATIPLKYYTYDTSDSSVKVLEEVTDFTTPTTYYTVGIKDADRGMVDYTVFPKEKNIITFKDLTDAENYKNSLNGGENSAITVSQADQPLQIAPLTRAEGTPQFEVFTFNNGYAYYRVNIAHDESGDQSKRIFKVVRNKFYKVNIASVNSLGFSTEDLLRPAQAGSGLDISGKPWISVSVSIAPWDEIEQDAHL
ncbi:MAG: fimbria major subunit [Muribaculaceae bacterium]|nr:fimbria major subunit [Muribaculaceae bacterium]